MAFTYRTYWYVDGNAGVGDDTNGGGFDPNTTGATKTETNNYCFGTSIGVISSAVMYSNGAALNSMMSDGRAFVAADIGHVIHLISGTNSIAGWYQIASVAGGVATLDANCWSAQNSTKDGVTKMGGAFASPGMASGKMVGGNTGHVKALAAAAVYPCSDTQNVSGGCISLPAGLTSPSSRQTVMIGYATALYDLQGLYSGYPKLQKASGTTNALVQHTNGTSTFCIEGDGNNVACNVFAGSDIGQCCTWCIARNVGLGKNGFTIRAKFCQAYAGAGAGTGRTAFSQCGTFFCYAQDFHNSGDAGYAYISGNRSIVGSVAVNCTCGFEFNDCDHCTAYNCPTGFVLDGYGAFGSLLVVNCLAHSCATKGFSDLASHSSTRNYGLLLLNCGSYNSGAYDATLTAINFQACTTDPCINAAAGDFTLNDTANGGNKLREAGFGTIAGLTPTTAPGPDIGAYQMGVTATDIANIAAAILKTPANLLNTDGSGDAYVSVGTGTGQINLSSGAVPIQAGTGAGQLDFTSGVVKANLVQILGTALTETAGYLAAGFKKFFNVALPNLTTGGIDQTGDNHALIGAAGAGLTALGDARIANLDAAVSTRTKPADTQAAVTTVTNLTNAPTAGDLTATMKTSVTTAATAATPTVAGVTANVNTNANATETAIKAKTDNLPASPAAVGSQMDLVNVPNATALAAAADAQLDRANAIETGITERQAMRIFLAVLAGQATDVAGTATFKRQDGTTTALTVVHDSSGDRTTVTIGTV